MLVRGTVLRVTDEQRSYEGRSWRQRTLRVLDEDAAATLDVEVQERFSGQIPGEGEVTTLSVEATVVAFRTGPEVRYRLLAVVPDAAPSRAV